VIAAPIAPEQLGGGARRLSRLSRMAIAFLVGAILGWIAWGRGEELVSLLAIAGLPLAWGHTSSRWDASSLMAGYFGAGARGLPHGAVVFFGDQAPAWCGVAMWAAVVAVLCVPYALGWARHGASRGLGFAVATLACAVPPFGLLGWLNPLSMAGVMFPAWGWVGLVLGLAALACVAARSLRATGAIAALAVGANLMAGHAQAAPARWQGFDTSFAKLSSAGTEYASQLLASMKRINWLVGVINDMPRDAVLILPETVLGRLDGVEETMLSQAELILAAKHSRVIVGAELGRGTQYANTAVVLGAGVGEDRAAVQGIPVPISMWKPWADDGAKADLLARGNTITVLGKRVGVSVCYEQLLTYSLLRLAMDKPEVLAAVSNVWWASSTNIPTIQAQSVRAYARLFDIPVVFARNI